MTLRVTTPAAELEAIKGRGTIPVWPDAARVLGISRNSAYRAAAEGTIPTLKFGSRMVVPVPKLLAMLGIDDQPAA